MKDYTLDLKPAVDGFGFIYGFIRHKGAVIVHINILPPHNSWSGDIKPPHVNDNWQVHLRSGDTEEEWQFETSDDLNDFLGRMLDTYNDFGASNSLDLNVDPVKWIPRNVGYVWWFVAMVVVGILIAWWRSG